MVARSAADSVPVADEVEEPKTVTANSIFRASARNNAWANHRLLEACARLGPSELHATRTSFFPTIMKTLNHILIVDWLYIDALERGGRGLTTVANEEPFAALPPLRDAQLASDRRLIALVDVTNFDADVEIQRVDHVQVERAGDILLHLFQHQIHHRGQAHAGISRRLGHQVVDPDTQVAGEGDEQLQVRLTLPGLQTRQRAHGDPCPSRQIVEGPPAFLPRRPQAGTDEADVVSHAILQNLPCSQGALPK